MNKVKKSGNNLTFYLEVSGDSLTFVSKKKISMKNQTEFNREELMAMGFEPIREGGFRYYQYCFNKADYFNSGSLVSSEVPEDDLTDTTLFTVKLSGVNPERDLPKKVIEAVIEIYSE